MFNTVATVRRIALGTSTVLVVDDALAEPEAWVEFARANRPRFQEAGYNAYPGQELALPDEVAERFGEFLRLPMREAFHARRVRRAHAKLAMVTRPESSLQPLQTIPHVDALQVAEGEMVLASVLYLFRDERLGGTRFFRPRVATPALEQLLRDAASLTPDAFRDRHNVPRGYPGERNACFECGLTVSAAWNRLIIYPGTVFHSGAISHPELLQDDPACGRLTLNGFFNCSRTVA